MKVNSEIRFIDVTEDPEYERFLYGCLFHSRKNTYGNHFRSRRDSFYEQRREYLQSAIPKGFHKKILIFEGDQVGTIEYAPAEGSGLPIIGDDIVVMNCIWVHRKARGHNFGKQLLKDMMESEKEASGFATLALENYWGPYFKKNEMESLGFRSVKSVRVRHKTKNRERCFELHLMWLPLIEDSKPPTWDESRLLEGVYFCRGHSLYHDRHLNPSQRLTLREVLEKCSSDPPSGDNS
jgi:GNAT superfamily N-acetyltransferase